MPKRTNDFQKLVYLVRVNLAEGAAVTESKMLADRITKRKREVDVCIEGHVGGYPVIVSVECRDHKRIADVTWVDTMKAKHERLPTNALILASRSGFTPEARDVAVGYGIQTFSLSEVDEADFPKLLGETSTLWTKTVTVSTEKVLVRVRPTSTLATEDVAVWHDNLVYSSDGTELYPINLLVDMMVKSQHMGDYLLSEGKLDHIWFELLRKSPQDHLGKPLFLKKLDPDIFREIESIKIAGPCKVQITEFGMRRGRLGDVQIAWGKAEILGRNAIVVATKDKAGTEKLSINLGRESE